MEPFCSNQLYQGDTTISTSDHAQITRDKQMSPKASPENEVSKIYLVFGLTGVGKSSFIQFLTNDPNAEAGHGGQSHTKQCRVFKRNEQKFIDSPGINDTDVSRYQILLDIVIYLNTNKYKLEDLFIICVSNKKIQNHLNLLEEFAYTYFLYELFGVQINFEDIEKLVKEYKLSTCLLNWQETGLHLLKDFYACIRIEIFKNKDKALNYIEYVQNLHIFVQTHYDKLAYGKKKLNEYETGFLREQIWSNKIEELDKNNVYKKYLSEQEQHLFHKIKSIIKLWIEVKYWGLGYQIQHILLIGQSQVGKSSLIEQLKKIKGLRGDGRTSKTSFCQIYLVEQDNKKYFFIDTPGFDGTERNQDPLHNLKIVADFLRRKEILEFKILYMYNSGLDERNGMPSIVNDLSVFIQQMFYQDSSLIDSEYLRQLIFIKNNQSQNESCQQKSKQLIKEQILTIERIDGQRKNKGKVYSNKFQNKSVEFQSDFYEDGEMYAIDKSEDEIQKQTLLKGVDEIDYVSVEVKIQMYMQTVSNCLIISNLSDYMSTYKEVKEYYQQYNQIQDQIKILSQNENDKRDNLNEQKIVILKKLSNKIFIVIGDFHNTPEMDDYIQKEFPQKTENNNQQNHQQEINNIAQNTIQKHFLKLQYAPFLFEANQNPENILLSRKQLYYWALAHQLKPFLLGNKSQDKKIKQEHKEILEKLSKIKILYELASCFIFQTKQIELQYDQNPEKVKAWIELFVSGINTALGTGAQVYRFMTYFSNAAEATYKAQQIARSINVAATWVNCVLSSVNMGIDIYSYAKGQICSRQMVLNTTFNIFSGVLSVIAIIVPGLGIIVGGPAGALALIGYGVSSLAFTSSQTFDETLGLLLKSIIDDRHPNQILLYFQKSKFLKELNIEDYSKQQSIESYEKFRELKKENFQLENQKQFLQKLFNNCQPQGLQDAVSQHIVKNIISNHFQFEIEYLENQNVQEYLSGIEKQLERNQQIINTYYNRSNDQIKKLIQIIKQNQKKIKVTFDNKKNIFKFDENKKIIFEFDESKKISFNEIFQQNLKTYKESLNEFIKHIKQTNYTYKEQVEFGNGAFRKRDRFPITFNGYCNIVHEKSKYIYKQDTISEISKNNNCFEVEPQINIQQKFFQISDEKQQTKDEKQQTKDEEQQTKDLNLLISCDKFIASRYLLKMQGQKEPNLSFMSGTEVIDVKVDYSIDLYEVANISKSFENFIENIKNITKNSIKIDKERLMRLRNFFTSIGQLKELFK